MEDFRNILKNLLPRRDDGSNKGTFGTLAVIGGSESYRGAPMIACEAALRCGVGICRLISTERVLSSAVCRLPEVTCVTVGENGKGGISYSELAQRRDALNKASAVLVGCGMGVSYDTEAIVSYLLSGVDLPIVIDADGLNSIRHFPERLSRAGVMPIITPHVGEMARLTKKSIDEIKADRVGTALEFSAKYRCITVLKDSVTVIASPDGRSFICERENSGLSKGGSGDALSGIIASLICQGLEGYDAALCGVLIHSLAGEITARKMSKTYMLPTDLISGLSAVFFDIEGM